MTSVNDLTFNSTIYEDTFDEDNIDPCDLTIPLINRLEHINNIKDNDLVFELLRKLNSMWYFANIKLLEEYLYNICYKTNLDPILLLESAKALSSGSTKGLECVEHILSLHSDQIPISLQIESIIYLLKDTDWISKGKLYLWNIVNDKKIESSYRVSTIQSLEFKISDSNNILVETCLQFINCEHNFATFKIVVLQYMLCKCKLDDDMQIKCQSILLDYCNDINLDENVRADAADVIMRYGNDEYREKATRVILHLGTAGRNRTIFENRQNVHSHSIESSANEMIEYLCEKVDCKIDYDSVRKEVMKDSESLNKDDKEKVELSLTRVLIDRATYGKFNLTLQSIICKVWNYIKGHCFEEELRKRLQEELIDSASMCSTGYAFRLVNVLSGYTDLSIRISYEDQIISNLTGRLNARIRKIQDIEYQGEILVEMSLPAEYNQSRKNFLKFFRENISDIRQEMFSEFKDYMTDTNYDLYFRKALIHYEGQ
jgi:hypothetical protein